jgi:hypothetical protein
VDRYAGLWDLPVPEPSPESSVLAVRYPAAWAVASVAKHSSWVDATSLFSNRYQYLQKSAPRRWRKWRGGSSPPDGGMGGLARRGLRSSRALDR